MKTEGASGQDEAHTPTMTPRRLGEEFVLLISVENDPQTSALVSLSSKLRSERLKATR